MPAVAVPEQAGFGRTNEMMAETYILWPATVNQQNVENHPRHQLACLGRS